MSIFATLAVNAEITHDGVRYKRDAVHGLVILDDNPPLEQIDASQVTSGVFDPARIPDLDASKITGVIAAANLPPSVLPPAWALVANNAPIAANGKHALTIGNTLNLVDIGEGASCQIRLDDEAASWLPTSVSFDVPATWTHTAMPDPGPGSIVTIICHSAAKQFTFHG